RSVDGPRRFENVFRDRQKKREYAPTALARHVHEPPALRLRHTTRDRKTQPGAAAIARRIVRPLKWLEETRLLTFGNAWPAIRDVNGDLSTCALRHDLDWRVSTVILVRVLHQVRERTERLHEIKAAEQQRVAGLQRDDKLLRA